MYQKIIAGYFTYEIPLVEVSSGVLVVVPREFASDLSPLLHDLTRAGTLVLDSLQPRLDDLHAWLVEELGSHGADALTELCERTTPGTRMGP